MDGFVIFVARGLPGDTVIAKITRVRRKHAEAKVVSVVTPGPHRISPPCPYVGTCGGCAWQALDYPTQLVAKAKDVRDLVSRIGGYPDIEHEPIVGATETFGYRNKVEYTFTGGGTATFTDEGEIIEPPAVDLGFHALGAWDEIVPVDVCLIADPRGRAVRDKVVAWARENNLVAYDRETGTGLLRTLVVRVAEATGEILVHLFTTPGKLPKSAELADDLLAEIPGVVGVLRTQIEAGSENPAADSEPELLSGRAYLIEELAGVELEVGAQSFLQTNTKMANKLYALAHEFAQPRPDDVMYDLYCGLGSIALSFAPHVDSVIGVEVVEPAIVAAKANAKRNNITNAEFQSGNVRPILRFSKDVWPDPTLVVVDPPRAGLVEKVIRRICALEPERVVYVSCNPATFAADLQHFKKYGYELVRIRPVDQFPHTPHVELVARLEPIAGWVAPEDLPKDPPNRRPQDLDGVDAGE
jgi:23S rRNA (uracil1939-C5)-methyltransferase